MFYKSIREAVMEFEIESNAYIRKRLLYLKEQKGTMSVDVAREVADKMEDISEHRTDIDMDNINLYCSLFEENQMSIPQNREAGNILLQPLFEHSGSFGFVKDRCISAYIISVRDDKKALSKLEKFIDKNSSSNRYSDCISNLKKESTLDARKRYLEDKNIRFITTNIIDIDGTLDYGIEPCKTEGAIGGRQKFNQQLIKMITEHPDDDFAICTRRIFTPQDRLRVCKNLIDNCQNFLKDEPENKCIAKFMQLLQTGKLKAYSKRDLMDNNRICLAGSITDDEMPEILGIQSISDATVSVYKSHPDLDDTLQPLWNSVPADRKITIQQFEDEKMLSTRMEYIKNPEMKFITTELIDQKVILKAPRERELDIDMVKLLLNKKEDWAIVYSFINKVERALKENLDNEILCKFKKLLEDKNKLIDEAILGDTDNICLVKPQICSQCLHKINALTDTSLSVIYKPTPMDSRIQKAYEKVPAERKITIQQYLDIQQQNAELEISPAIQDALDRVQTQKQKLDNKKESKEVVENGIDESKSTVVTSPKQTAQSQHCLKDMKNTNHRP